MRLFYNHNTVDYRLCGTIPRPTIRTTNLMQWCGTICILNVFLLFERKISPNYAGIFLDFVHGFGSYVKGLPKTKQCNSVAVTVYVRIRCICETALRQEVKFNFFLVHKANYYHLLCQQANVRSTFSSS